MTQQPILIKNWRVFDWAPDDIDWLTEQKFTYRIATNNIPFAQGNKVTYIRGNMGITVETTTPEQELLLKLKFEPGLVCMMQTVMIPHGECTLSDIDWSRV